MFNFSLAELILVILVAFIFVKPGDLPEIAHFFGKIFMRGKIFFNDLKKQFKEVEKEFGLDEIKQELNRGMAEEKIKSEKDEGMVIVDIYGEEHRVDNPEKIRPDLTAEAIKKEIAEYNSKNSEAKNSSHV